MQILETMIVKDLESGEVVQINVVDFDEKKHKAVHAKKEVEEKVDSKPEPDDSDAKKGKAGRVPVK